MFPAIKAIGNGSFEGQSWQQVHKEVKFKKLYFERKVEVVLGFWQLFSTLFSITEKVRWFISNKNGHFQDGASVHRTQRTLNYIQSSFGNRTLALGSERWGGTSWSPNSPDLAPLDFCIWGVMKVRIEYSNFLLIYCSVSPSNMFSLTQCPARGRSWWPRSTTPGMCTSPRIS